MKKWGIALAIFGVSALAACSTPTPEVIVVTATPDQSAPTQAPPEEPGEPDEPEAPDDGLPPSFVAIITPRNGTEWNVLNPIEVTGSARDMPND